MIFNLSVGYFGLQIAFGIQSASLSRIFQGLGAPIESLALLWLAGPVTGLLIQPVVGPLSDRHWTRFGRRRPYILVAALVIIAMLVALPFAPTLAAALAAIWLLEAAMNALHAPYRALVGDILPRDQQGDGYAMQTVFIGIGAFAGACAPVLLTMAGVSNIAAVGMTASSIRLGFLVAAACVAMSVGWTVVRVREYSRAEHAGFDAAASPFAAPVPHYRALLRWLRPLRRIATVQCCSWFGFYLLWVYATPLIAARVFGARTPFDASYGRGADFVGILFGIYNGVAGVLAFLLPWLFRRVGPVRTHALALCAGAAGLAGIGIVEGTGGLLGCAVLIGIAYASVLSAPFVMAGRAMPGQAAGGLMGVMNIFIVLPQLAAGLGMGWVVSHIFAGALAPVMLLAGMTMLVGAVVCVTGTSMDAASAGP